MRVLLINRALFGGGAERSTRELFAGLRARGVDAELWTADAESDTPDNVVPIRGLLDRRTMWKEIVPGLADRCHFASSRKLRRITTGDFDVVHLHSISGGWLSIRAIAEVCRRIPTIWTHHDLWGSGDGMLVDLSHALSRRDALTHAGRVRRLLGFSSNHHNVRSRQMSRLLNRHVPQPALHICPSEYSGRHVAECGRFPDARIRVRRHGLTLLETCRNQTISKAEAKLKWGLDPNRKVVLMIAANIADVHKGIRYGIEALGKISGERPPQLLLLGKSSAELLSFASSMDLRQGVADCPEDLFHAYRAADVTLLPSLWESMSYVALESMACATPLVGFDLTAVPEVIRHNKTGLLVRPVDTDAMSDALNRLLNDACLTQRLGENGREWVQRESHMETYLDDMMAIYREISQVDLGTQSSKHQRSHDRRVKR